MDAASGGRPQLIDDAFFGEARAAVGATAAPALTLLRPRTRSAAAVAAAVVQLMELGEETACDILRAYFAESDAILARMAQQAYVRAAPAALPCPALPRPTAARRGRGAGPATTLSASARARMP